MYEGSLMRGKVAGDQRVCSQIYHELSRPTLKNSKGASVMLPGAGAPRGSVSHVTLP